MCLSLARKGVLAKLEGQLRFLLRASREVPAQAALAVMPEGVEHVKTWPESAFRR